MTLTWPWALAGLLVVPVLVVGYRRVLRVQDQRRVALAEQGLVMPAPRRGWRRHAGPALLIGALTVLVLSLTRPVASFAEPHREGTVVLAFDVSNSMAAKDVKPSRLEAAKAAARGFVEKQPPSVRIAVVAFGGPVLRRPPQAVGRHVPRGRCPHRAERDRRQTRQGARRRGGGNAGRDADRLPRRHRDRAAERR